MNPRNDAEWLAHCVETHERGMDEYEEPWEEAWRQEREQWEAEFKHYARACDWVASKIEQGFRSFSTEEWNMILKALRHDQEAYLNGKER